jgi:acetyltransferase-like isoleucine patch superfamily enzyme
MSVNNKLIMGKKFLLGKLLKSQFGHFGNGSSFDPTTSLFMDYQNIFIGDNVYIGPYAILSADGVRITIGDDTIIGPGLYIMAGDHLFDKPGIFYHNSPKGVNKDVTIGRNVWIGARVTILKGVKIHDSSIIGAGSVVTRDVPEFSVVAGNPARFMRLRFSDDDIKIHKDTVLKYLKNP